MSVIIDIDFEGGDLSEWTSTVNPNGDLTADAAAALAGSSFGMAVNMDDTTAEYGQYQLGTDDTSGIARIRFYFDPNGLVMNNNTNHFLGAMRATSNICTFRLNYATSVGHSILVQMERDADSISTSQYPITDEPHYIEVQVTRSTDNVTADGTLDLWIDGVHMEQLTGINFDTFPFLRMIRLGHLSAGDLTTSGTYYIDEIIVNNDGSEIGAVGGGGTTTTLTADAGSFSANGQAVTFSTSIAVEHGSFS
jgi:hypothetical protein